MEPLSPKINLILGENGQGKSNFLDSIMFCLTNKYSGLRQEEKKCLLHGDSADHIEKEDSIFSVEVTFNNKNHYFPIEKDTIIIQKTYNVLEGKEEMFLNHKKISRGDINNLFENAGLGRNSPYYIIQQGRINLLVQMNENELYELFTEIAGAKIFEEKKKESDKLIEENKDTIQAIVKQKEELETVMKQMNLQCVELNSYADLESKRKQVEAFILSEKLEQYQIFCQIFSEALNEKKTAHRELTDQLNGIRIEINRNLNSIEEKNQLILDYEEKINRYKEQITNLNNMKQVNKHQKDMENNLKVNNDVNVFKLEKSLSDLKTIKETAIENLKLIESKLANLKKAIENKELEFGKEKNEGDFLLMKDAEERADYIKKTVESIHDKQENLKKLIAEKEAEIKELSEKLTSKEKSVKEISEQLGNLNKEIEQLTTDLISQKKNRTSVVNSIKKANIDIHSLEEDQIKLQEKLSNTLVAFPSFELMKAYFAIKAQKFDGVLGVFLDFIECGNEFKNAVDIILGNRLYTIIVDTFDTAQKIIGYNKQNNGPVITVIPLDFVKENPNGDEEFPEADGNPNANSNASFMNQSKSAGNSSFSISQSTKEFKISEDSIALNKVIKLNKETTKSFSKEIIANLNNLLRFTFNKCYYVKSFDSATTMAKNLDCTCVTKDDEYVERGGFNMKLGFYQPEKQRQRIYENLQEIEKQLEDNLNQKNILQEQKNDFLNKENEIIQVQQKALQKKTEVTHQNDILSNDCQSLQNEINNINSLIYEKQRQVTDFKNQRNFYNQRINAISDIQTNLGKKKQFTENQSIAFIEQQKILGKQLMEMKDALNKLERERKEEENKVNNVLPQKENEISKRINELKLEYLKSTDIESNLVYMEDDDINKEISVNENEINNILSAIKKLEKEISNLRKTNEVKRQNM